MPAMPEVATKLLKSFERDDLSLGQLTDLIVRDQVLSAKVLRLANSGRYSPGREVASLSDAAACLGMLTLRDLTLSACMTGAFPKLPGFDRLAFWKANLSTGVYAQTLAKALDADPDVAYMGGMMLRTGQMLMAMVSLPLVEQVATQAKALDSRISYERAIVGRTHPEVTSELARHWKFPDVLQFAFAAASDPMEAKPFSRLGAVLRLASVVTEARDRGEDAAAALSAAQGPMVDHLKLDLAWVATHLPDHATATSGAESMLG